MEGFITEEEDEEDEEEDKPDFADLEPKAMRGSANADLKVNAYIESLSLTSAVRCRCTTKTW